MCVGVGEGLALHLVHPVGVRDELVDGEAVFPEEPRGQPCAVVVGFGVMLGGVVHDDLDGDGGHVAARGDGAVAGVPGNLGAPLRVIRRHAGARFEVLPSAHIVGVEMNAGAVHVLIGPGGAGVLLSVVIGAGEVVGVVDGDALHLAGASAELGLLLVEGVGREASGLGFGGVSPAGAVRDDLLVDGHAVGGVGVVRFE